MTEGERSSSKYRIVEYLGFVGKIDNFDEIIKGTKVLDAGYTYSYNGDKNLEIIFDNGYALILEGINGEYPEDWFMCVVRWEKDENVEG